jgi:hypothetical protein
MVGMLAKGQFTLRALFVATSFIALACAAVRYILTTDEPTGQLLASLPVPILVCGAVGVICGRLRAWLSVGIFIAFVLIWLVPYLIAGNNDG